MTALPATMTEAATIVAGMRWELREVVVTIPGRPPTPNDRSSWQANMHLLAKWRELAYATAIDRLQILGWDLELVDHPWRGKSRKPKGWQDERLRAVHPMLYAARVAIEVIVPTRAERDWDNLVASTKPLTDGLVDAGVLAGDSTRFIGDRPCVPIYRPAQDAVIYTVTEGIAPSTPASLGL